MRKYTGTIVFIAITIIIISMFYVGTARANQNLPQFIVKKTAGSIDESVEVYGNLYSSNNQWGGLSRTILIDNKESKYQKTSIFNEGFDPRPPYMEKLKKKYRSFFRKKDLYSTNEYYEDDQQLGNAVIDIDDRNPKLKISILDKKRGDIKDFETEIPKELVHGDYASIGDVQIFGNEMKIVTSLIDHSSNYPREDIVLFTVDLEAKKLTDIKELYKDDNKNAKRYTQIILTNSASPMSAAKHFVFAVVTTEDQEDEEEEGGFISKEINRQYFDVDMETSTKQEIGSAVLDNKMIPASVDGNKLYAIKRVKDKLKVQIYDLDQKKNLRNYEIEWPGGLSSEMVNSLQVRIQENKLIMSSALIDEIDGRDKSSKKLPQILIVNKETGKLRWQGVVISKDASDFEEFSLNIEEFKVK